MDRLKGLEQSDKDESVLSVGNDFKVGKSTVHDDNKNTWFVVL